MKKRTGKRSMRLLPGILLAAAFMLQTGTAMAGEWDWNETIIPEEEGLEGDFALIREMGLKMWLPSVMKEQELNQDMKDAGYLQYYTSEEGAGSAAITYVDMDGITLSDYQTMIEDAGGTGLEVIDLNGLGALSYEMKESDLKAVSMVTEKGYVLEFLFSPVSDADFAKAAQLMASSITSTE